MFQHCCFLNLKKNTAIATLRQLPECAVSFYWFTFIWGKSRKLFRKFPKNANRENLGIGSIFIHFSSQI
jgi:hypothetical protein